MKQNEDSLLREKLKEYFGFSSFKGNQEAVIRNVLSGKDTFVLMPTGGGKSLCYQLPALLMDGVAIVISPLIALMKNQVDAMRTYSNDAGIAHFLNSSLNKSAVAQVRNDVLEGRTKLLYFAPESLTKEDNVAFLRKVKVSFYAIDEDKSNDIYLYFKEDAQSDSLDEAIEELGGDYTEEEIRLVRIKFMCEQGN